MELWTCMEIRLMVLWMHSVHVHSQGRHLGGGKGVFWKIVIFVFLHSKFCFFPILPPPPLGSWSKLCPPWKNWIYVPGAHARMCVWVYVCVCVTLCVCVCVCVCVGLCLYYVCERALVHTCAEMSYLCVTACACMCMCLLACVKQLTLPKKKAVNFACKTF